MPSPTTTTFVLSLGGIGEVLPLDSGGVLSA